MIDQQMLAQKQAQDQKILASGPPLEADYQEEIPNTKRKEKAKRYPGLLEWIQDREGHEYLTDIDRSFLKNESNHHGIREKMISEMNLKKSEMTEKQFKYYLRHLYKAAAPTTEALQDEKYMAFIHDLIDLYCIIHCRYVQTEEGKFSDQFLMLLQVWPKFIENFKMGCMGIAPELSATTKNAYPWA